VEGSRSSSMAQLSVLRGRRCGGRTRGRVRAVLRGPGRGSRGWRLEPWGGRDPSRTGWAGGCPRTQGWARREAGLHGCWPAASSGTARTTNHSSTGYDPSPEVGDKAIDGAVHLYRERCSPGW